jgi:hypothetical protein
MTEMSTIATAVRPTRETIGSWSIELLGVTLGLAGIGLALSNPEPPVLRVLELGLVAGVTTILVYGGYHLRSARVGFDDQIRIAVRVGAGAFLAALFGVLTVLHQGLEGGGIVEPGYYLVTIVALGALIGLLSSATVVATGR